MTRTVSLVWALTALAVVVGLLLAARRLGRANTAGWLVVVGLVVLALEEPLLCWFWATADPHDDEDGMSGVVTAAARAHVLDTAIFGTVLFVLLGWIARTAFRRAERWASRVLLVGWVVVAATLAVSTLTVNGRGLPVKGGHGLGWEQLAVGLLAWACGLWLQRSACPAAAVVESGA